MLFLMTFSAQTSADVDRQQSQRFEYGSDAAHRHSRAAFQFALIGDTRYTEEGASQFGPMREEINQELRLSWVMHAGDILGGTPCDDDSLFLRLTDFQAFRIPFIYSPGDNEWTDCHSSVQGGFHPLERLAALRTIFFPVPGMTLGHAPFEVDTQASEAGFEAYVENVRWVRGGIVFVAVHIVGSANGLRPWNRDFGAGVFDPSDTIDTPRQDRIDEVVERVEAGLHWIDLAFELAYRIDSPGVFILSHANPRFGSTPNPDGFVDWRAVIQKHAVNFKRPVVLAHGDSHTPRVDKPLTAPTVAVDPPAPNPARVENFTRVETFGSPDTHWIRVLVDPMADNVFSFEFEIVDENRRQFVPIQ
jgi:hypothetical protein